MAQIIREAPLGQLLRLVTGNRLFPYQEEKPDYQLPEAYITSLNSSQKPETATSRPTTGPAEGQEEKRRRPSSAPSSESGTGSAGSDLEKVEREVDNVAAQGQPQGDSLAIKRTKSREETTPWTEERLDVEVALAVERTQSRAIAPVKSAHGDILVEWYTTDDVENPQNWSQKKKFLVSLIICVYTFVVYSGSAIYTASEAGVIEKFGISKENASLPLSLYVLAYGIGPLIWAPLSEIPAIGRSPVYAFSMAVFVIVSIPTPLVNNFAGLLVLRFLQGFFGSPCLAIGAATMQDMYSFLYLPYALTAWVSAAYCGPALGPLLAGFAVTAKGWRWSLWEILWAAGPTFIAMFVLLPETSTPNILLRRAKRLRKITGDSRVVSESEIVQKNMKTTSILIDAIIKPLEITIKDPAIAFVNLYTAIIYGIYYSFFEVFPLVYPVYYGFSLGIVGVVFTCVLVACLIGVAIYCIYLAFYLIPDMTKNGMRVQESRLIPALPAAFGPTIGLFLFGWTARASIHWIVPTIGIVIYSASVFVVMQCIFVYVPLSYPQYAASLFAANDFFRSALACGSIMFARPLFLNLDVAKGVSLLGGLSVIGIIGIFALWLFGAKLRARSKFAQS